MVCIPSLHAPSKSLELMLSGCTMARCAPRWSCRQKLTPQISQFQKIKRALQFSLPEELFLFPSGGTGSSASCSLSGTDGRLGMGFHGLPVQGWSRTWLASLAPDVQLKNPHARSFTHVELRDAMLETLKHINKLLQEAGVVSA